MARGLLSTLAAMSAPCSVKTKGSLRLPPHPELDVAGCDFKLPSSCAVSWSGSHGDTIPNPVAKELRIRVMSPPVADGPTHNRQARGTVKEYRHVQGGVTLHAVAVNGASPTALCSRRAGHREAQ
jgi:hypothetical protein